jgi:hypothetical protein
MYNPGEMKILVVLIVIIQSLLLFHPTIVIARSGCCSHHGGICGCGCCDGTSLSTTCAPYYPSCSKPVYVAPVVTKAPVVYTPIPSTPKPMLVPTIKPANSPTSTPRITKKNPSTPESKVKSATTEGFPTTSQKSNGSTIHSPLESLVILSLFGTFTFFGIKYIKHKIKK